MSYLVLARKWRPQRFDDVVGQQTVTRTLRNAITSGRVAQALVFAGSRGCGKATTLRAIGGESAEVLKAVWAKPPIDIGGAGGTRK